MRLPPAGKPVPPPAPVTARAPLNQAVNPWAAVPLVALAGCVDAIGWLRFDQLFVSFISGTSTMLGIASAEAFHATAAKYDVLNPPALRRLVAGGTQLRPYPREVMTALYKSAQELYAEIGEQNPRFRKIHEHWDRFRVEQVQWFRVAEDSLANFQAVATAPK